MAIEVELKAHINNIESVKLRLSEKAEYLASVEKHDTYWQPCEDMPFSTQNASAGPLYGIRIRREKRITKNGCEKTSCFVTNKSKQVKDGVEINEELEFEVKPAEVFEKLLKLLGFRLKTEKEKRGWIYSVDGITAELVEIKNLGWFIEMEILLDDTKTETEKTVPEEAQRLKTLLDKLGIDRKAIESRSYNDMLKK